MLRDYNKINVYYEIIKKITNTNILTLFKKNCGLIKDKIKEDCSLNSVLPFPNISAKLN